MWPYTPSGILSAETARSAVKPHSGINPTEARLFSPQSAAVTHRVTPTQTRGREATMRILWCSNGAHVGSGYGTQTELFVPQLNRLGHPTAILAYYGSAGGMTSWNGIPVYPPHLEPHGQDVFGAHAVDWRADIGMSLMDLWVTAPERYPKLRVAPWFPIDQEPIPEMVRERAVKAWQPIVMSQFGLRMAEDADLDARYLPHAFDPHAYYPMEQGQIRDALGVPRDAFIVGMVAANVGNVQPRKAWYEQIEGFAMFKRTHPDALLMLHTSLGLFGEHQGVNIGRICEQNGLVLYKDVLVCDQYRYLLGFDEQHMRATFNAFDVHVLLIEAEQVTVRSEEHTSELQSPVHLVCRLLLEKKKREV